MTYIPVLWLVACILLLPYRPGFLLGCAILSFQFDSLYNSTTLSPLLLVMFFCAIVFVTFIQKRVFVFCLYDYLIIIFGALYAASSIYSPNVLAGISISGRLVLLGLGYYFIGRLLSSSHIYKDNYIYDFGASILILTIVFGLLSVAEQGTHGRLHLGTGSAVGFSQMLDVAVGYSLFYLLSVTGKHAWIKGSFMAAIFASVAVLVLLNATRGTIASLVFAISIYMAISIFRMRPDSRFLTSLISLGFTVIGLSVILIQLSGQQGLLTFGFDRLGMNFGAYGIQSDSSTLGRMAMLRQAWEMFSDSPLFGQGIGSFLWNGRPQYPHNLFMELLAETGLITTTVFTIILARTGWMAGRLFKFNLPEAAIVAGLFFITLAHQQVSFALWMAKPMFLSMGIIASLHMRFERLHTSSSHPQQQGNSIRKLLPNEYVK